MRLSTIGDMEMFAGRLVELGVIPENAFIEVELNQKEFDDIETFARAVTMCTYPVAQEAKITVCSTLTFTSSLGVKFKISVKK